MDIHEGEASQALFDVNGLLVTSRKGDSSRDFRRPVRGRNRTADRDVSSEAVKPEGDRHHRRQWHRKCSPVSVEAMGPSSITADILYVFSIHLALEWLGPQGKPIRWSGGGWFAAILPAAARSPVDIGRRKFVPNRATTSTSSRPWPWHSLPRKAETRHRTKCSSPPAQAIGRAGQRGKPRGKLIYRRASGDIRPLSMPCGPKTSSLIHLRQGLGGGCPRPSRRRRRS